MDAEEAGGTPAPWRRRLVIAFTLLVVAGAAVAIVLGTRSPSPHVAQNTGSAAGAATVQRRNLVERDTESGTLSYSDPQTVYNRLSGTITWLPAVGKVVERGQTLFEVDSKPVILLYGSKPAYRELDSSDESGPDVGELNANLVSLGYDAHAIVLDDTWQTATTDAVKELQQSLGERQTGKIALGQVVFLPGEQLINAIDGTVGSPASYAEPASSAKAELVDLTSTTKTPNTTSSTTSTATSTTSVTPTVTQTVTVTASTSTKSESSQEGGGKSSSGVGHGKSGGGQAGGKGSGSSGGAGPGAGGTAILQTSSTRLVATVDLQASSQSEAVVGSNVTVELPNGSIVGGKITSVSPIANSSGANSSGANNSSSAKGGGGSGGSSGEGGGGGSGSSATVPVTITLDRRVRGAGLDQAPVSVDFEQARARNVLCVPVTALVATSGSTYAVQEAAAPHKLLPVSTGLFAAGYVEISGPGIHEGLTVTDSQG